MNRIVSPAFTMDRLRFWYLVWLDVVALVREKQYDKAKTRLYLLQKDDQFGLRDKITSDPAGAKKAIQQIWLTARLPARCCSWTKVARTVPGASASTGDRATRGRGSGRERRRPTLSAVRLPGSNVGACDATRPAVTGSGWRTGVQADFRALSGSPLPAAGRAGYRSQGRVTRSSRHATRDFVEGAMDKLGRALAGPTEPL